MTRKELQAQIKQLKREMKEYGIKRTSCFNGGLDLRTYQYNSRLFILKCQLEKTS